MEAAAGGGDVQRDRAEIPVDVGGHVLGAHDLAAIFAGLEAAHIVDHVGVVGGVLLEIQIGQPSGEVGDGGAHLAKGPAHLVGDVSGRLRYVGLLQQGAGALGLFLKGQAAHLLHAIGQPQRAGAVLEGVLRAQVTAQGGGHQRAHGLFVVGMDGLHRAGHQHMQHGHRGGLVLLHEAHEFVFLHLHGHAVHVIQRLLVDLREVHELLREEIPGEVLRKVVGLGEGVLLLLGQHGAVRGAHALHGVLLPIADTEIVVQRGLDEQVQAQAVAEAVEHGKPGRVVPVGHVDTVPVGLRAAHAAQGLRLGHLKGQRVHGVVKIAVALRQRVGKIGHAAQGGVHRFLEDVSPDAAAQAHLHHVGPGGRSAVKLGYAAEILLLELKIRLIHGLLPLFVQKLPSRQAVSGRLKRCLGKRFTGKSWSFSTCSSASATVGMSLHARQVIRNSPLCSMMFRCSVFPPAGAQRNRTSVICSE